MQTFIDFVDKKKRDANKHLSIIGTLLEKNGFKVKNFLNKPDDAYLYVEAPDNNVSFGGIRVYVLGNQIAFRIQKDSGTAPFGVAYPIDIEEMFEDLLSDHGHNPEKAGEQVIKCVVSEIKRFFENSASAEKELRANDFDPGNPFGGKIAIRSGGMDYSNSVPDRNL